jgi:hypothetical protein
MMNFIHFDLFFCLLGLFGILISFRGFSSLIHFINLIVGFVIILNFLKKKISETGIIDFKKTGMRANVDNVAYKFLSHFDSLHLK